MTATIFIESWAIARSQRVTSAIIATIVAIAVAATLLTVGRSVQQQREIAAVFTSGGGQSVVIEDDLDPTLIVPGALARVESIDLALAVVGLGSTIDVRLTTMPGAAPVPARAVFGANEALVFTSDEPGAFVDEAAMTRLGLTEAGGAVTDSFGHIWPIVGRFRASGPFSDLSSFVLVRGEPAQSDGLSTIRRYHVVVDSPAAAVTVGPAAIAALGVAPGSMSVSLPIEVADLQAQVESATVRFGSVLVAAVLGLASITGALAVFAVVSARRRDYGRRRALGSSRVQLVALVESSTVLAAVPGACVGVLIGVVWLRITIGGWIGLEFPLAAATLAVGAVGLGALPSALVAGLRDPLNVLRTP